MPTIRFEKVSAAVSDRDGLDADRMQWVERLEELIKINPDQLTEQQKEDLSTVVNELADWFNMECWSESRTRTHRQKS